MKKVIILASERSGTNLLRTLLGNHPDVDAPVAPHFLDTFFDTTQLYGDLKKQSNMEKLLHHMIQLANHSYHDWKLPDSARALYEKSKPASLAEAFDAIYSAKAEQVGKSVYVCKDNHMFNHVFLMERLKDAPDIRYVYLYRDPRDNVVSWMKRPLYMHTPYEIAKKWAGEQRKVLDLSQKLGINIHFLKYEKLIANPAEEMTALLSFIGISVSDRCFQTDTGNKESKRNEYWENLSKPIIGGNSKKYLEDLSPKDLLVTESVCAAAMRELGYDLETAANWSKKKDMAFKYQQKLRIFVSKKKNKDLLYRKMSEMQDKISMVKGFWQDLESGR